MNILLSPEGEKLVKERVASSDFESAEALICQSVARLLHEDEEGLRETGTAIEEALEQSHRDESR